MYPCVCVLCFCTVLMVVVVMVVTSQASCYRVQTSRGRRPVHHSIRASYIYMAVITII